MRVLPVKLFTRNNCSACTGIKEALNRKGWPYTEVNIEEDHEAAWALIGRGFRTVPVLEADGDLIAGDDLRDFVAA